jgi:lipopolysaccharide export system permease protein
MRTVRRLFYADVIGAVAFVTLAFLALFFFIDFVAELSQVGRGAYRVQHAALFCLLELPGYVYELLPISVLIGSIYAMARLAQSSEFTILRTAGLGPGRALWLLATLGLLFGLVSFGVGDYVAPYTDARGDAMRNALRNNQPSLDTSRRVSVWLKDRRAATPGEMPAGERIDSIHVGHVGEAGQLSDVRIFEFGADGRPLARIAAERARIVDGGWQLEAVQVTRWGDGGDGANLAADERRESLLWSSTLTAAVVSAAVAPLRTMSTLDLYRYIGHLADNDQAVQRQQIQFWKKALYPLACLVMVGLALPFAYLHARSGSISVKVFAGILLGISFVLLNNLSAHLGLLRGWTPWIAAAAPSALYLLLSMAAFSWLVRYR